MIYDRPSMLTNSDFPTTPEAQSAAAKWLTKFFWKGIFSYINCRSIKENKEPLMCSMSYTKVLSYDYFVILQCQTVSLCRSLYDYQTHILLRPNGWLGSFERIYFLLLCGEVFKKKKTSRYSERCIRINSCCLGLVGDIWSSMYAN